MPEAWAAAFTVRPVSPSEYAALGAVIDASYRAIDPGGEPEWYYERLRDVAARACESSVLVAVAPDGEVLGGVTYVSGPEDPYSEELQPGEAGIRMLGVAPAAQGHGVGRALVDACVERARQTGRRRVVLHTGTWMQAAQRMYERIGFRREPAGDWQPLPGTQLLCYVLDLDA